MLAALVCSVVMVSSALASAWPGPPRGGPPGLQQLGPPPAWLETAAQSRWMAYSSYCWSRPRASTRTAVCADMAPPQSREDLPSLAVRRGAVVRIHLSFAPREAHVTLFRALSFKHYVLRPQRVLVWRAAGDGVLSVDVRAAAGSVAYLLRLTSP